VFVHRLARRRRLVTSLEWLARWSSPGGIGENSSLYVSLVLGRLGLLGLTEEPAANARHGRDTGAAFSLNRPRGAGRADR